LIDYKIRDLTILGGLLLGEVKILLVEDESIEAMDIKRSLESFGYEVPYVASSGDDAIKKASQFKPDIVLMDIVLKGEVNGISAASKIKDLDIPVIFLTAHSEESTVEEAKITEPYGYLIKPYDPVGLKNSIELALYRHEMESKLKKSKERYRSILENIQDAYFRADLKGRIIMASPSAASIYRFRNPQELIGVPTIELYKNPDDRDSLMEELVHNGKIEDYECEGLRKDGTSFWVSMNVQFHYDDQGNVQGTEGFMRDITQRKNAENQIKKSENYYRTIFEHTGNATILIDQDRTISLANSEFEKLSGFVRDEIEGKKKWTEFVVREDLARMKNFHDMRRNEPDNAPENYEFQFITRQGDIKDILLNVANITGTKKSVASLLDITQRKKAETAFHHSEKRFRTLFELNTAVMILLDPETGNIIDANPSAAEFYGYSLETLRSMNINQINQLPVENVTGALDAAKKGGNNFIFPHKIASGEIRTVEVLTSPIPSEDKVLLFSIINDITERRKTEMSLEESEAKFRFITDKINDIVWTQNLDLQTTYVSPSIEKILGFSQEERLKQKIQEQLTPSSLNMVKSILEEQMLLEEQGYRAKDRTLTFELEYYHKDGSTRWMENSVSCIRDDQDNLVGIHGVSRDITQRKKDEEALKKVKKDLKL
jgi:PAS domain S-box-containing protein